MYQILSHLPESVVYTCSCCSVESPASWLVAIKAEIQAGLRLILSSLLNSKYVRFLGTIKVRYNLISQNLHWFVNVL